MSYFGATGPPVLDFLAMSPLGFKARVGSTLFAFCGGECNVHSQRSTSGATLACYSCMLLLATSMQPVLSPHTVAEVRLLGFELMLSDRNKFRTLLWYVSRFVLMAVYL